MASDEIESCRCCLHSEQECHELIRYAQMGYIGRVRRRLNEKEKSKIKPGSIFIYKEQESGIKRWTDKKEWTPSRMHGIFLIYRDLNGPLLKKTYSVEMKDGKYHIVAYTLVEWEGDGQCCVFFNKPHTGFRKFLPVGRRQAESGGDPVQRHLPGHAGKMLPQSSMPGTSYYKPQPSNRHSSWPWSTGRAQESAYYKAASLDYLPCTSIPSHSGTQDTTNCECYSVCLNEILSGDKGMEQNREITEGNDGSQPSDAAKQSCSNHERPCKDGK